MGDTSFEHRFLSFYKSPPVALSMAHGSSSFPTRGGCNLLFSLQKRTPGEGGLHPDLLAAEAGFFMMSNDRLVEWLRMDSGYASVPVERFERGSQNGKPLAWFQGKIPGSNGQ